MVRERSGALMSPRGPGAVELTLGFTSLTSHPVQSLRWDAEIQLNDSFSLLFPHPGTISSIGAISPMGAISRMIKVTRAYHRLQLTSAIFSSHLHSVLRLLRVPVLYR